MTEKNKNSEATEIDVKLEANEIMRLSVFKVDEEKVAMQFRSSGKNDMVELRAISQVLDEKFDMVCIPISALAKAMTGVVCTSMEGLREILSEKDESGKFC